PRKRLQVNLDDLLADVTRHHRRRPPKQPTATGTRHPRTANRVTVRNTRAAATKRGTSWRGRAGTDDKLSHAWPPFAQHAGVFAGPARRRNAGPVRSPCLLHATPAAVTGTEALWKKSLQDRHIRGQKAA